LIAAGRCGLLLRSVPIASPAATFRRICCSPATVRFHGGRSDPASTGS
jgi:hypothetical protein